MKQHKNIGRLMGIVSRHTKRHYNQVFTELGLGSGGHVFILILSKHDSITQNEITSMLHFDKAHTARTILKLIELGYVIKQQDDNDKRSHRLFLTEKGKSIIPIIEKEIKNWNKVLTSDFSTDEKNILFELLNKMVEKSVSQVKSSCK